MTTTGFDTSSAYGSALIDSSEAGAGILAARDAIGIRLNGLQRFSTRLSYNGIKQKT